MNDEAAFLARIRDTPDDVAPRLVYADWLDERDDPRGELIRVTEEMRTLPVYSERYWALKPRYKKLKANAAYEWRTVMGYNQKRLLLQHGFPADVPSRWRLIRECVERWFDIDMPDIGGHTVLVGNFQRSFGRRLPLSLREYISFGEDIGEGLVNYDGYFGEFLLAHLEQFDGLYLFPGGGDSFYAILNADCHHDDPPVYLFDWDDTDGSHGELSAATLSEHTFYLVARRLSSTIGWFDGPMLPRHRTLRAWLTTFPNQCKLHNVRYYENATCLIWVEEHLEAATPTTIHLLLMREVKTADLPACVWEFALETRDAYGVFAHENRCQ
jgi:uncharacterized protein (TIGR02996 family)